MLRIEFSTPICQKALLDLRLDFVRAGMTVKSIPNPENDLEAVGLKVGTGNRSKRHNRFLDILRQFCNAHGFTIEAGGAIPSSKTSQRSVQQEQQSLPLLAIAG